MENLNSLESILAYTEDENNARKLLCNIRWGEWAKCPFCNNAKAYFIENGTRYKCANKSCYKKFSVSTLTLLSSTNLPFKQWIMAAMLFIKTSGRVHCYEIEKEISVNSKTALIMKDKFDFAWKYVIREDKDKVYLFKDLFMQLFSLYKHNERFQSSRYNNQYHISDITNISDPSSFDKLLHYCKIRMYFCTYIYFDFASPGEIMTEVVIYLHDNSIKDYNADFIIKLINRTISRMWDKYRREHPNLLNQFLKRQKERKAIRIRTLSKGYLVDLIKSSKKGKDMTRSQIKNDVKLLEETKNRLLQLRKKGIDLTDYHSHFD